MFCATGHIRVYDKENTVFYKITLAFWRSLLFIFSNLDQNNTCDTLRLEHFSNCCLNVTKKRCLENNTVLPRMMALTIFL